LAEPLVLPNSNRVDVKYKVIIQDKLTDRFHTFAETHPMRHFSIPEIDLIASWTGFQRLQAEEFLTGIKPGENTWGVCFILRKK